MSSTGFDVCLCEQLIPQQSSAAKARVRSGEMRPLDGTRKLATMSLFGHRRRESTRMLIRRGCPSGRRSPSDKRVCRKASRVRIPSPPLAIFGTPISAAAIRRARTFHAGCLRLNGIKGAGQPKPVATRRTSPRFRLASTAARWMALFAASYSLSRRNTPCSRII